MSLSSKLTCQSTKANIVIRKNREIKADKLDAYCKEYFSRYAWIEHKGDISVKTGEVEGVHYHIVGDFKASKVAFSTRLNTIAAFFNFENADGIEIDKYNSLIGSLQYLTHQNQPDKTPHKKDEIHYGGFDKTDFDMYMEASCDDVITFDYLFGLVCESNNIIEVIRGLGLGNYRTWRNVVWDMWNEIHKKDVNPYH